MKRVLCVIMTKFFEGGGLTSVMMNYYRELWSVPELEKQFVIDFLSHDDISAKLQSEIEAHGSKYYKMPGRRDNPIGHYLAFAKVLKKGKYDVIHFNCNSGLDAIELAIARKYVPNRICHIHCSSPKYPVGHTLLKGLMNRSYTQAIAVSQAAGTWMYGEDSSFVILNNAIKTDSFSYNEAVRTRMRSELDIADNTFVVGNVGRMSANNPKNHGFLLESFALAAKSNVNLRLVIVGDGALLSQWTKAADDLGIADKVIFAGFRTNIPDYMQSFDLFCFPSQSEGLGMVAIEAQASGLPCIISTEVPEEVELSTNIERLGITEGDESTWANRMLCHATEANDRAALSREAQDAISAKGYDVTSEVLKLVDIYNL